IIYSESSCRYYVGSTQDIQERLRRHNEGHSKSTRSGRPWRMVCFFSFPDRAEAMALELIRKS
ncbi:MAG: GIY-YIG nuclease family protein, partial [Bacteroidales bacterium]|nr:GIY-YIG nuclease family protein [Bacteroidales bacterium]